MDESEAPKGRARWQSLSDDALEDALQALDGQVRMAGYPLPDDDRGSVVVQYEMRGGEPIVLAVIYRAADAETGLSPKLVRQLPDVADALDLDLKLFATSLIRSRVLQGYAQAVH